MSAVLSVLFCERVKGAKENEIMKKQRRCDQRKEETAHVGLKVAANCTHRVVVHSKAVLPSQQGAQSKARCWLGHSSVAMHTTHTKHTTHNIQHTQHTTQHTHTHTQT